MLGVAHILPWVPLLIYLTPPWIERIKRGVDFAATDATWTIYLGVFIAVVGLCVSIDAVDVVRWFAGERYVLGSKSAAARGASRQD